MIETIQSVDTSNPSEMLPLLKKNGYTVYAVSEVETGYNIEFCDCPTVRYLNLKRSFSTYFVDYDYVDEFNGDGKTISFILSDGTEVVFDIKTDTAESIIRSSENDEWLVNGFTIEEATINRRDGEYYVISYKEPYQMNSIKGETKSFDKVYLHKDDAFSVNENQDLISIDFDGRHHDVMLYKNSLELDIDDSEINFDSGDSVVEIPFTVSGATDISASIEVNSTVFRCETYCETKKPCEPCVKATCQMNGCNGILRLEHLKDVETYVVQTQDKHSPGQNWIENYDTLVPAFDSTIISFCIANGNRTLRKTISTVYDDLGYCIVFNAFLNNPPAINRVYVNERRIKERLGIKEAEKNTFYHHFNNDTTVSDTAEYNLNYGFSVYPRTNLFYNDEFIVEQDEDSKSWMKAYFSSGNIMVDIKKNNTDKVKVATIAVKRRHHKKVIYHKIYMDYRDSYELYGLRYDPVLVSVWEDIWDD